MRPEGRPAARATSRAAKVAEIAQQYRPDAIFIDGGGPGGGVVDRLRQLQHAVFDVQFGGKADHSHIGQDGAIVYANIERGHARKTKSPATLAGL
jgi:hypothetical protein